MLYLSSFTRAALTVPALLLGLTAVAQQTSPRSYFADDAAARRVAAGSALAADLRAARPLTLDVAGLRSALTQAPLESQRQAGLVVVLPLPDGSTARFRVLEAPVMAPELAAKFPAIKTYVGSGLDDPTASLRLELTQKGFHAQVLTGQDGTFYIDPATRAEAVATHYLSYWRRDRPNRPFACLVKEDAGQPHRAAAPTDRTVAPTLRTYRLAVAATGEYTEYQGGTVADAMAAIVVTVDRVVGVYEKELAVRMVLVAGNDQLVYTDANTDPYTNDDPDKLLDENQDNVDAIIKTANYDIGHVFSTGGGGLSGLGVVCDADSKASSETGSDAPVGDSYDIDYVAHEMGHEFGANHTFNSVTGSCGGGNRNASTAYEPGSGTTIMAYAGICGSTDTQQHSDAYFHVVSYEEILTYLATTSCAVSTTTGNTAPAITLPASGKVLPINTPFKLTAAATDADGDALTYCWEEWDKGAGGTPTATQVTNATIPLFRSFSPTTSATRYFPRLSDVAGNKTTLGERLPTVARPLKFRVTVRDEHAGTQGVVGGVNSSDIVTLSSTAAAGPFLVTAPNTAVTWLSGSTQTVTWDVANTTASPVSCATVNIRLSTDGGFTYPTLLLAGTPNDGSQAVTLPDVASIAARIMVEAADNYFFDISNVNFVLSRSLAVQTQLEAAQVSVSPNPAHGSFHLAVPPVAGQRTVQATLLDVLGQAVAAHTLPLTPAGLDTDFDLGTLAPGVYVLRLEVGEQKLVRRVVVE